MARNGAEMQDEQAEETTMRTTAISAPTNEHDAILVVDDNQVVDVIVEANNATVESSIRTKKQEFKPEKLQNLIRRDVLLHLEEDVSLGHKHSFTPAAATAATHDNNSGVFRLLVLDFVLGHVVVGPLITACWRAAWIGFNLFVDGYLFINNPGMGTAVCVLIGIVATNCLCVFVSPYLSLWEEESAKKRERCKKTGSVECLSVSGGGNTLCFYFVSRCYTLFTFLSVMIFWKGWWDVCELEGADIDTGLFMFTIGLGRDSPIFLQFFYLFSIFFLNRF
jgi:hypothetical protein